MIFSNVVVCPNQSADHFLFSLFKDSPHFNFHVRIGVFSSIYLRGGGGGHNIMPFGCQCDTTRQENVGIFHLDTKLIDKLGSENFNFSANRDICPKMTKIDQKVSLKLLAYATK